MAGSMKVLGRVFVLGRIAAADVPARQAQPQEHPRIARLHTVFTDVFGGLYIAYVFDVLAAVHASTSFLYYRLTMSHPCRRIPERSHGAVHPLT
jgi:hypothetical protein